MQPGDILLVQLDGGPRLARYIETAGSRLRLAIGRNREARLTQSRVIHETGMNVAGFEGVEALREQAETELIDLDLEEVWDIVCDDGDALTLSDIGELYLGDTPSVQQTVAILMHLLTDDLLFVRDGSHFLPRDRETVSEIVERRQRLQQRTEDAEDLASAFRIGTLPKTLTQYQYDVLEQVRGYVLHGDDYTRANAVKRFLESAGVRGRDLQRATFEALVRLGIMDADEHLDLERNDIVAEFPELALTEAEAVDQAQLLSDQDRADFSGLLTITIDDAETRDRDDALSIETLDSGSYRVGIHITDAGALIEAGSALDIEADRRMSSLYLPEQTISMLPSRVSAGSGSLNPEELRAAISVLVELTADGELEDWKVVKSVTRSDYALAYEDADAAIADSSHPLHPELSALDRLAKALRKARENSGALSLDRDELSVKVDACGQINVRVVPRVAPARSLVEEYMVLCNSLLARYCVENELPAPFRAQTLPDMSDIMSQFPPGALRAYLMTRRLTAATVSTKPGKHGGLGVDAYTQATSPLRRYPDLLVQRQISYHLRETATLYDVEAVTSVAHRADMQVRLMSRIENNRRMYYFLKWLDMRRCNADDQGVDVVHQAVVLENQGRRTALLEMVEWPVRTRAALPASTAAGEVVSLQLHGVDLWRRTAQFTYQG